MIIEMGRFGRLSVEESEKIRFPEGVLGFPEYTEYCLVDPGDDTLILWLQCLQNPGLAFPVLEPKIFRPDYSVKLSGAELRQLHLENVRESAVFSIITIPENVMEMTANLKAPVVVNLRQQVAKQVVLQENEYSVRHLMFKELRAHLMTIQAQGRARVVRPEATGAPVRIQDIPPSLTVKSLSQNL